MAGLFYHDVFAALTGAGVPFVVVGGVAVNLQGVPRFTADLDVAVALDGAVLTRVAGVLGALGLKLRLPVRSEELGDTELVRRWVEERNLTALTWVDPAEPLREVDLLIAGPVPFEELLETADRVGAAGMTLAVASIPALIRMKSGTGREQDASDVAALRKILRGLDER